MKIKIILGLFGTILSGCMITQGTVMPLENKTFNSYAESDTRKRAIQMASSDMKITCKKTTGHSSYIVLNQEVERYGPPDIKMGKKWLDVAIRLSGEGEDLRKDITYEVTTTFKCA